MKKASVLILLVLFFSGCSVLTYRGQQLKAHPEWPAEIIEIIKAGDIFIGMTKDQVMASRGRPLHINKTTGEWGVHEQWCYTDSIFSPKSYTYAYIYFENGIVTSWQSR